MSCWTGEKLYKLVQIYSKFSNLWDRKHHCYDNLRTRYTSYSEILTSLSMPIYVSVSDVICKLKEIRNIYVCELKKIDAASRAGCTYRPNHTWFGILNEFLYDNLDADEKLAEFSSSEDGTISSEEMLKVCLARDCCFDSNSTSDSDSECSFDWKHETPVKKLQQCCKPAKKSQAYFLRSPTALRSTKMNTRYEFPGKKGATSSTPGEKFATRNACSTLRGAEDMQQCIQLDVKMTSSDVSIKYLRTESVNGDEKCYKKNLKGPRCSKDKPQCFKNIKMIISKSGYAVPELAIKSDDRENEDTEFWEMMSMLDLGVPCPLAKLETTHSPNTGCNSITKSNGSSPGKPSATCCASSCKDISDKNGVSKIIESRSSNDRFDGRQSCCSKVKPFEKCDKFEKGGEALLEPCTKKTKVMCLGDGTLFDDNLLELLQDLSIKICPVDAQCASGNCSTEQADQVFDGFLRCKTCSSATWPVKEFQRDVQNEGDSAPSNRERLSTTEENPDAARREKESAGLQDDLESSTKPENDLSSSKLDNETDSTPLNTPGVEKVGLLSVPAVKKKDDVKAPLELADSRSSSERDAILHEAKKELWEAGKSYNGGKYIGHEIVGSREKNHEFSEFDDFGAQVASSLKMMGKERAGKLKQMIAETIRGEKRTKFF